MIDLVLTLIGPDHPGIVDSVSEVVAAHGGNWLESRMAHLAGKFAGVLCVEVAEEKAAALEEALGRLAVSGLKVIVERSTPVESPRQHAMEIELLGVDRPGLVHEISALLAARERPAFVSAVRALDRVLMSGFYAIPVFSAGEQWIARWNRIEQPVATALTGYLPESWWQRPVPAAK